MHESLYLHPKILNKEGLFSVSTTENQCLINGGVKSLPNTTSMSYFVLSFLEFVASVSMLRMFLFQHCHARRFQVHTLDGRCARGTTQTAHSLSQLHHEMIHHLDSVRICLGGVHSFWIVSAVFSQCISCCCILNDTAAAASSSLMNQNIFKMINVAGSIGQHCARTMCTFEIRPV